MVKESYTRTTLLQRIEESRNERSRHFTPSTVSGTPLIHFITHTSESYHGSLYPRNKKHKQ